MFLLASLILFGAVRLAKREVIERGELDKASVRTFTKEYSAEVERLDELYLIHLQRLAENYTADDPQASQKAKKVAGLVRVYELSDTGDLKKIEGFAVGGESIIPYVGMMGAGLEKEGASILLHAWLLEESYDNQSGWLGLSAIEEYKSRYILRWLRGDNGCLIAIPNISR